MRILYIALEWDYGDPSRGLSFEHVTFYSALVGGGHHITHFDPVRETSIGGSSADMRKKLLGVAAASEVDLVFMVLFKDELDGATIAGVRTATGAPVVNWFCDDHWRFESFSRKIAPHLDLAVTTDAEAVEKYRRAGVDHVHYSQWACNTHRFYPNPDCPKDLGAVFVGQPHSTRVRWINRLEREGVAVTKRGYGWPEGRASHEEMLDLYWRSTFALNFAQSSVPSWRDPFARFLHSSGLRPRPPQLKGRVFEIPGTGTALVTEAAPGLEGCFDIGREVLAFSGPSDLSDAVRALKANPSLATELAEAGYRRVLAEHTYEHRFRAIFAELGLSKTTI